MDTPELTNAMVPLFVTVLAVVTALVPVEKFDTLPLAPIVSAPETNNVPVYVDAAVSE